MAKIVGWTTSRRRLPAISRTAYTLSMAGAEQPPAGTAARSDDLIEIAKTAIGAEVGLSPAQSRRLVGGSADELRRDAREMAREFGLAVDDDQRRDQAGRYASAADGRSMNELIRAVSGRGASR